VNALKQIGVHNPVVLGHSWGALVAIAFGLRTDYPIRGLVLASGYYFPTWRLDVWIMSGPAIPILGDLIRYTVAPIISWAILPIVFRKIFEPRSVPNSFKDGFPKSLMLRPKQLRAAAEESAFLVPAAAHFQASYSNLRCPVRIFHGTGDQVSPPEQARHLDHTLRDSELHLVQGAGHMVTYVDCTGIAQAVDAMRYAVPFPDEMARNRDRV
jgi:pimeloyl-ACP methyl ester carboxylesterase